MVNEHYNPDDIETQFLRPSKKLMDSLLLPEFKRETLEYLYREMSRVLNRPDMYDDPVEYVEAIEYSMQVIWGFVPNKDYHNYWHWLEGCTCPNLDNEELMGTGRRIINGDCPFHNRKEI